MGSLSLDVQRSGPRAVVSLSGELDLATVPELREAALAELAADAVEALVLDLGGLTFVDSTGLGCWVQLHDAAECAGSTFALAAVPPATVRVIRIAGLATVFGLDG